MIKFFKNLFTFGVKIGDHVKCIDDTNWYSEYYRLELKYNKVYKVFDIYKCPCCNNKYYDIGVKFKDSSFYSTCFIKNSQGISAPNKGMYYVSVTRFVKTKEPYLGLYSKEDLYKQLDDAIENENYEEAIKLRDIINHEEKQV